MAELAIYFLDVGQGDGTFIRFPDGTTILVDLGSKKNAEISGPSAIATIMDQMDPNDDIDYLFLTHGDGDHYNLLWDLDAAFSDFRGETDYVYPFKNTVIGGTQDDYTDSSAYMEQLFYVKDNEGTLYELDACYFDASATPYLDWGAIKLWVLSANYPAVVSDKKNAKSIVLLLQITANGKTTKVILTGDAEKGTEKQIMDTNYKGDGGFLRAYGLKLGHHGSKNGSSKKWIEAVQPLAVFASGDQKWGHPYCETIKRVLDNTAIQQIPDFEHGWVCGTYDGYYEDNAWTNHFDSDYVFSTLMIVADVTIKDDEPDHAERPKKRVRTEQTVASVGTTYTLSVRESDGKKQMWVETNYIGEKNSSGWYN